MARIEITSIPGGASVNMEGTNAELYSMLAETTAHFLMMLSNGQKTDRRTEIAAYARVLETITGEQGEAIVVDMQAIKRAIQGGAKND